ncbi:MAG: hypothetical protein H7289_16470, partial [Mucilaginibacter sp.]|nr:hypothetical protein [Mucilaginibacter sp.]
MRKIITQLKATVVVLTLLLVSTTSGYSQTTVWNTMKSENKVLKLSIWFTAQEVDKFLSTPQGMNEAVNWCKKYGATKVHLEAFGRGLYAKRETLIAARDRFRKEGIEVASGVTTTKFGKDAVNGGDGAVEWTGSQCYTNKGTQQELQRLIEYTASMFDEIILDDWYFTQCQCDECIKARGDLSWPAYYTSLMTKVSRERVVGPAHRVNPNVKVIIKYPQWYDQFHMRGYDVVGEPPIFDGLWIGTEDRNFEYDKNNLGYEIGYNAYFNMRWQATLGVAKGGGWFDTGGTRTKVTTYMEQARHTVLGEGNTMILWSYGGHVGAPNKMDALLKEYPGLIKLAKIVQGKPIKGVHMVKPGNSEPFEETWLLSFLGELGIPFVPASVVDEKAKSAVFTVHALKDPDFIDKFQRIVNKGTPLVLTDGLAKRMADHPAFLNNANVTFLPIKGSPKTVLNLTREQIKVYRDKLLAPFEIKFDAPSKVELYLFGDNTFVVENINETA